MAQPAPLQASVEKTVLTSQKAAQSLNPFELNRRGEISAVTFSVPVFSEKNTYLVVRLPQSVAQELIRAVNDKPADQREQFIREWVTQNQVAIYSQYLSSKAKRFSYEVVPVASAKLAATPRKVGALATEGSPIEGAYEAGRSAAREAQKPTIQTVPSLPQQEQKPPAAKKPEPSGRTLNIPDQSAGKPPEVKLPDVKPAAPQPKVAKAEEGPREVEGGTGSKSDPFKVNILRDRSKTPILDFQEVSIPMTIVNYHFEFSVTMNQVANSKIEQTYVEIITIAKRLIAVAEGGGLKCRCPRIM